MINMHKTAQFLNHKKSSQRMVHFMQIFSIILSSIRIEKFPLQSDWKWFLFSDQGWNLTMPIGY